MPDLTLSEQHRFRFPTKVELLRPSQLSTSDLVQGRECFPGRQSNRQLQGRHREALNPSVPPHLEVSGETGAALYSTWPAPPPERSLVRFGFLSCSQPPPERLLEIVGFLSRCEPPPAPDKLESKSSFISLSCENWTY